MDEPTLTAAEFGNVVHKQMLNVVLDLLSAGELDSELVRPFVEAARDLCRGDVVEGGARIRLHALRAEGEELVEAEEAYVGLSVRGREDGEEWLSETWWLSDVATAEEEPAKVRAVARALERSLARIEAWLADRECGTPAAGPPASPA